MHPSCKLCRDLVSPAAQESAVESAVGKVKSPEMRKYAATVTGICPFLRSRQIRSQLFVLPGNLLYLSSNYLQWELPTEFEKIHELLSELLHQKAAVKMVLATLLQGAISERDKLLHIMAIEVAEAQRRQVFAAAHLSLYDATSAALNEAVDV